MKGFGSIIDPHSESTPSVHIKDSTSVELVVIHATDNITINGIKILVSKRVKSLILQMYNMNWFENNSRTKYSLMLSDGHHYVQATCNPKANQQCQLLVGTECSLIRIEEFCVQYYSNKYILGLTDISITKNDLHALVGIPSPFTIKKSSTHYQASTTSRRSSCITAISRRAIRSSSPRNSLFSK